MSDQQEWPPERLRALDRAVAEARGQVVAFDMPDGPDGPAYPWIYVAGDKEPLPCYSKGTCETFELMVEERIEVTPVLPNGKWLAAAEPWTDLLTAEGPTPAIAICLAYLAAKGVSFRG